MNVNLLEQQLSRKQTTVSEIIFLFGNLWDFLRKSTLIFAVSWIPSTRILQKQRNAELRLRKRSDARSMNSMLLGSNQINDTVKIFVPQFVLSLKMRINRQSSRKTITSIIIP